MDTIAARADTQSGELARPGLGSVMGLLAVLVFAAYTTFIATAMVLSPDLVPFIPMWIMLGFVTAMCAGAFLYAHRLGKRTA